MSIWDLLHTALQKHLPVAVYRVPGRPFEIMIARSRSSTDPTYHTPGFYVHPFIRSEQEPLCLVQADLHAQEQQAGFDQAMATLNSFPNLAAWPDQAVPEVVDESTYLETLENALAHLRSGSLRKFIFSRVHWEPRAHVDIASVLLRLAKRSPNALVYYVQHPQAGAWMGASPEILLRTVGTQAETTSLAGTRPAETPGDWGIKEQEEQALVTDYIRQHLQALSIDFRETGPHTTVAGPVEHLQTNFAWPQEDLTKIPEILQRLHPTPAVCGLPVPEALEMIRQTEKQSRSYYTGFLGPVMGAGSCDLYVHLRCMQVFQNGLALRAGGGITAQSDPQAEWRETEQKLQTLLRVL